jgi:phosphatidylserine/phosphatidylglycerophosphate/cardiolipin synthase-like enzyme
MRVRVYHNGDDVFIAWKLDGPIEACRGFALLRRRNGVDQIVETWVGFKGQTHADGESRASTLWPIQRFQWTDYMADPGDRLQYRVVPMVGPKKENLHQETDLATEWTKEITLNHEVAPHIEAYFNRGIVAAQWVSKRLGVGAAETYSGKGKDDPAQKELSRVIDTAGDPMRKFLMGDLGARLLKLLKDALDEGREVHAALYEFGDSELEAALIALGKHAHVVLANDSPKARKKTDAEKQQEAETGKKIKIPRGDPMAKVRARLKAKIDLHDRILPFGTLGHNKFLVVSDAAGKARWVWTGSTNWTKTGLCTQANNAVLVDDADLAAQYLEQWNLLKGAGNDTPKSLKLSNTQSRGLTIGQAGTTLWFTPTVGGGDLKEARSAIESAEQAILFLMFNPGPSADTLLGQIVATARKLPRNKPLYIRGALNQDPSTKAHPVELFEQANVEHADFEVVLPAAIDAPTDWFRRELRKTDEGIAMVHSKVVVIDPFGAKPVVITGSHNLGPKASRTNDENLLIIRDVPGLASAYATNIMAIFNQYNWRFNKLNKPGSTSYQGLRDSQYWQPWYWKTDTAKAKKTVEEKFFEMDFWVGQ